MSPRPEVSIGSGSRAFLLFAFFASGAVGLAYEVAWSRALLLLLGSTATASAIVLGVFVGALGLGARWGGPRAERTERPLAMYAALEIAAAVWALLSFPLIGLLESPYVAIASGMPEALRVVLRVILAAIVIAPAAFLLGATLPAMVRHWVEAPGGAGRGTAWLYGINTVGAVLGCLWTGFTGIEALGVSGVLYVAAAVGAGIGVVAWIAARVAPSRAVAASPAPAAASQSRRAIGLAFLCGFIGLAIEVLGFRILVFFVEGFTVTFAAMLGVFIAGLGVGSLAFGPWLARSTAPTRVLGVLLIVEALVLLCAQYWIVPNLESAMRDIKAGAYAGASTQAEITAGLRQSSLLGSALLLFVPALLLGPTFSLCVRFTELQGSQPAVAVGRTYLGNALGSLTAPLVVTFLVVPWFGVLGGWLAVYALVLGSGLALAVLPYVARFFPKPSYAWAAIVCATLLMSIPLHADASARALVKASVVMRRPDRTLVDTATDAVTTASVVETRTGERYLYTDDFAAAATGRYYRYMRMLGHLPALLSDRAENAMVIAFGTGTTAGAVARHESVTSLEVVEVSSAVLELADYFGEANRYVLRDKRTVKVLDDGRNALLLHEPDLDIITLEPLMPYSPAGLPFYTREFYELAKSRLREGGVVCQWVPVHAMPADLYAAFVRTFFEVFPEGSLWFFEQSTALIGRKGEKQPSAETVSMRMQDAKVRADLVEAGFSPPWMFASGYVAKGVDVLAAPPLEGDRYAQRPVRDQDPYPEFQPTPRASLNTRYLTDTLGWLVRLVEPTKIPSDRTWWPSGADATFRRGTALALEARRYQAFAAYLQVGLGGLPPQARAERLGLILQAYDTAAERYREAMVAVPGDRVLERRRVTALRSAGYLRIARALGAAKLAKRDGDEGEWERWTRQAESMARQVLPPVLPDPEPSATDIDIAAQMHAATLLNLGRCSEALAVLQRTAKLLHPKVGPNPLAGIIDAVEKYMQGGASAVPAPHGRFFADALPCREEGIGPIRSEWEALESAWSSASRFEVIRGRASLLVAAALREGAIDSGAERVRGLPAGPGPEYRALRAVMLAFLDPGAVMLRDMLRSPDDHVCAAALREMETAQLLHRHVDEISQLYARTSASVQLALAKAAAKDNGRQHFDCLLIEMLMSREATVRKEALTALFTRAEDALAEYDYAASAAERRPIYEAMKKRFDCP